MTLLKKSTLVIYSALTNQLLFYFFISLYGFVLVNQVKMLTIVTSYFCFVSLINFKYVFTLYVVLLAIQLLEFEDYAKTLISNNLLMPLLLGDS